MDPTDPLWDLLGQAPAVQPSPFFTRNVLRAVREAEAEATSQASANSLWALLLRLRTYLLGGAVATVALLFSLTLLQDGDPDPYLAQNAADIEVIAHLDELLASEETSVWLDQPAY